MDENNILLIFKKLTPKSQRYLLNMVSLAAIAEQSAREEYNIREITYE